MSFVVSKGPAQRPVPAVTGLPLEGAAFQLGRAGLLVGELSTADSPDVPVGAVISTQPAADAQVAKDTKVAMVVSTGPPPVPLPGVVGRSGRDAAAALAAAGFVTNLVGTGSEDGTVTVQDPAAGTVTRPGQIVTITVGAAGG